MAKSSAKPVEVKAPDDFDDADAFLDYVRKQVRLDLEYDQLNRDSGLEDTKFMAGDQWDDTVRARREAVDKPCLTVNRLPAFVGQIVGNRLMNETVAKVVPDNGGTKAGAALRQGILRNLQKNPLAEIAYTAAHLSQVVGGVGNFQLELVEAYGDVFEQDLQVSQLPNGFSVVWDRQRKDPTGRDARHVSVVDTEDEDDFKKQYPDAVPSDLILDQGLYGDVRAEGWFDNNTVRVVHFWRVRVRDRNFAMLDNGAVEDVTDKPEAEWKPRVMSYDDGTPVMRTAPTKYAECYVLCGTSLLEGPYELPIDRVPIFRVPGWEINEGEMVHRWGLIRHMKDPQRLHNYWRSVIAERLQQSPKAVWKAGKSSVQGREKEWRESHRSDDTLLIYDDESGAAPERVDPAQIEAALIQESGQTTQDLKDVSNIHEASLGQQSNEVSGKAIVARQRVTELGAILYQWHLDLAISECGRVANQVIPFVYNSKRMVKIIGPDDEEALAAINDPFDPASDVVSGKYSTSITTGPNAVTKRIEAAEAMLNMVNAMPQTMAIVAPEIIENQDWPGADKIARKLRATQPSNLIDDDDKTPAQRAQEQAEQQASAEAAQLAQAMAQIQLAAAQAGLAETQAKTKLLLAQARKAAIEPAIKAASEESKSRSTQLHDTLAVIDTAHPKQTGASNAKSE